MGKYIVTYNELAELNRILEEKDLKVRIHMHDLCGSQSFSIKAIDKEELIQPGQVRDEIIGFFSRKGLQVNYSEANLEFSLQ